MRLIDDIRDKTKSFRDAEAESDLVVEEPCEAEDSGTGENALTDEQPTYEPCTDKQKENKKKRSFGSFFETFALFALMTVITLCAVVSRSNDTKLASRITQLQAQISVLQSDYEKLATEKAEADTDDKADYGYNSEGKKAIDESSVYYGLTYKDLWDDESFDDEVLALLEGIAKIHYGTAGSSLQLMGRGADFVIIAKRGEEAWKNISAHLDTMSPAELDYLSFRLLDAYYYALDIVRGGSVVEQLEEIGFSPELYEGCTEVHLARFLGYMIELFDEKGVEYEWETYDIMTLFR